MDELINTVKEFISDNTISCGGIIGAVLIFLFIAAVNEKGNGE